MADPLIDEATKKVAIAWVAVGDQPARALWCMPADPGIWLVTGPGEQQAPGLTAGVTQVVVTLRGSHGGRVVSWPAQVTALEPGSERWGEVAPLLAGKRLNAPGDAGSLVVRWASECAIYQLAPAGYPIEAGAGLPSDSQAAPPRPSDAKRPTRAPFRLHRVRRRR